MSNPAKIGLACLVVLSLLVFLFPSVVDSLVDKDRILQSAEGELRRLTDLDVEISEVRLTFIPVPRVHFDDVVFHTSLGDSERPIIEIPSTAASLAILPLLSGKAVVKTVRADNPTIKLYREKDGRWNYKHLTSILRSPNLEASGLPSNLALRLRELQVDGCRLELGDSELSFINHNLVFEHIDIILHFRSTKRAVQISAALAPKKNGVPLKVQGEVGPLDLDKPIKTKMDLSLNGKKIDLADYQDLLNQLPFELSGNVTTNGTFTGTVADGLKFVQKATYDDIGINTKNGLALVDDFSAELIQEGTIKPALKAVTLEKFSLNNEGFEVNAAGSVHHKGVVPVMDLVLPAGWLDLKAISAYVPGFEQAFDAKGRFEIEGKLKGTTGRDLTADLKFISTRVEMDRGSYLLKSPDPESAPGDEIWVEPDFNLPLLPLSIRATVSVDEGRFEWLEFKNLEALASLKDYWISMDEMTFDAFGGKVNGSAWLNMMETPPAYGNDVIIRNMEIDEFLTAFAGLKGIMSGKATTKLYVSGRGRSMAQFKNSTTGVGQVRISSGRYSPVNFLDGALKTLSLTTPPIESSETKFNRMNAYVVIKDGEIDFKELRCRCDDWSLNGEGVIRMDQTMALEYIMTLSDSITRTMKPDEVARFQRSPDGRLQLPFNLSGTFTQPSFSAGREGTLNITVGERSQARLR